MPRRAGRAATRDESRILTLSGIPDAPPRSAPELTAIALALLEVERPASTRYRLVGVGRARQEVAKFSRRGAERLPEYERRLDAIADELRAWRWRRRRIDRGNPIKALFGFVGLLGGDIFHGALSLDPLFSARPMLGHADCRGALRGLYLCGAATRLGGGVTGAPGHNAARAAVADLR